MLRWVATLVPSQFVATHGEDIHQRTHLLLHTHDLLLHKGLELAGAPAEVELGLGSGVMLKQA